MPAHDWRSAKVDVVIPALNEQENILRCLASALRQTLRPRKIVVVDDGSTDARSGTISAPGSGPEANATAEATFGFTCGRR